jgi:hypothetical protein
MATQLPKMSLGLPTPPGPFAPLEIFPADGRRYRRQFLQLPRVLYHDDPVWIAPLILERKMHISHHNPYHRHAEVQTWIARRGNRTVGRISAQIDQLHLERYNDNTGFFGFLEAEDDAEVFRGLLNTAEDWLRHRGIQRVRGPFNFSINEECGLLVEGFDSPPAIMMGHARPYYAPNIHAQGYEGIQDLLAYQIKTDFTVPIELDRLATRLGKRVKLRPLDWKNFQQDLAIIKDIFEDAWAENWGFIPFTDDEFSELGKNLKLLVPGEFVRIAEVDGEPAAMMVVFPNLNEAIRDLDGSLLPFGWLKLLWRLKVSGVKSGRVPLMGVRRRFQDSRMGAILALMMITALQPEVRKRGMQQSEMSWILESNTGMRKIIESIGGWPYKRYRIYQKNLR